MKKNLLILFVLALGFSACEGPEGPQGIPGRDGDEIWWYIDDIPVRSEEWRLVSQANGENPVYTYVLNIAQLTDDVYYDGNVQVYFYEDFNTSYEIQRPLPFVLPKEAGLDNWITVVDYDFNPGQIKFYITYSDFNVSERPGNLYFRVVLSLY